MDASRAVLVGGPLDGSETAPRTLDYIYVGVTKTGVRVFDKPAAGRLLYRAEDSGWRFVFAGDTHARCEACDTVQAKAKEEGCMCGGKLIPA